MAIATDTVVKDSLKNPCLIPGSLFVFLFLKKPMARAIRYTVKKTIAIRENHCHRVLSPNVIIDHFGRNRDHLGGKRCPGVSLYQSKKP